LKLTVPPVPGSVTLVRRFSKSHARVVVFDPATFVCVLPLESKLTVELTANPNTP